MTLLSGIKSILESHSVITTKVYLEIIDNLPAGLMSKLRLVPDAHLSSKLSHLLTVARIEDSEVNLGFPYKTESVEGLNDAMYFIDHDAIVTNLETDQKYIIDCTSDSRLASDKATLLSKRIIGHPHIDNTKVHIFEPKTFDITITRPENLRTTSSIIFDLLETISSRSARWKAKFFDACEDVYQSTVTEILNKEREELLNRYSTWDLDSSATDIAIQLCQDHTPADAILFEKMNDIIPTKTYFKTFERILSQQNPITAPFYHKPSVLNTSNKLIDVLKDLQDNVIALALYTAINNTSHWVAVKDDYEVVVDPIIINLDCKYKLLPEGCAYRIIVRHRQGHSFIIRFRSDTIDENFKEQICKFGRIEKKKDIYEGSVTEAFKKIDEDFVRMTNELTRTTTNSVTNTVLGKIATLAQEYTDVSCHAIQKGTSVAMLTANFLNSICLGELINHDYEVAKCFAASLKVSPRRDEYYVGVNGPFASITLTRMSSTQDSFTSSSYFTIYRTNVRSDLKSVRAFHSSVEGIIQSKTRSYNKNTIGHALKLPFIIVSLLTWEIENNCTINSTIISSVLAKLSVNCALHASVNSDQFAQAAEQLRYLFTSNTGLGASAEAICEKINFVRVKSVWELVYIFRMLKLGAAMNTVYKTKSIGSIIEDGEFNIMFPNSVILIKSFSYIVSSMYYANVYNKFRAFHEVSEAICYNELIAENKIYEECKRVQISYVHGICEESLYLLLEESSLDVDKFVRSEKRFCASLVDSGPGRFKLSISFIIGATSSHARLTPEILTDIYKVLGRSPIDACTMKGAMSSGRASSEHQGIRAASAMLEELIEEMGEDVKTVNSQTTNGTLFYNSAVNRNFDFSILSAVSRQFEFKGNYQYRIVQKDQKGHREISVLNAKFRLGALLCESISHECSTLIRADVLDNPSKDMIIEDAVRSNMGDKSITFSVADNSDQKRWGPNHLLHAFSAMFFSLLRDDAGLFRLVNNSLHYGECKFAKFPENLVDLGAKVEYISRSEPISEFFFNAKTDLGNEIYGRTFEWGMCQGIFHRTSSLYHGIMCNVVSEVIALSEDFPEAEVVSFVTSDDAERIIHIKETITDRVSICRRVHSVINNVGCVMNILRNESKSVFSAHITEFNSVFYHKGILATPTLKQRISKIDIGDGADPLLDYLTASSLAMAYFQSGGSFVGTIVITLLNLVLHTEQWNRWDTINKGRFNEPVELGGFPAIDPFAVLYSGPISTFYFKWQNTFSPKEYAYVLANTIMLPASEVTLNDFIRDESKIKDDTGVVVFKSAGPLGVISLNRTDRKLSQFERRHKMSKWFFPEDKATLNSYDSSAIGFLFNLLKITKAAEFDYSLGVNSFYVRFTDPWVNINRKCYKAHENSYINRFLIKFSVPSVFSAFELDAVMNSISKEDLESFIHRVKIEVLHNKTTTDVAVRLNFLLTDAAAINSKMSLIVDPIFSTPVNRNSIVKVNLSTITSVDEDVFKYSLLKSVIGDNIKSAVIRAVGNSDIWEKIETFENLPKMDAASGIHYCNSIIQTYSRYIRRSIKIICPGDKRPIDIPDLLNKILTCKFTEKYGIPAPTFDSLTYTAVTGGAFLKRNSELQKLSNKSWIIKESNINVDAPIEPIKYYIESESDIITAFDSFTIVDKPSRKKSVMISSNNKLIFMQKIHLWSSINVSIVLSEKTKGMLINNEYTNRHEYCINDQFFVKNQTGLKYTVTANGINTFELQYARISGPDTDYEHVFFVDSNSYFINANATASRDAPEEGWHIELIEGINNIGRFKTGVRYHITNARGRVTDSVIFIAVTNRDEYIIRTYSNNLTLFLEHVSSGYLIPVCSQNLSSIKTVNLGFNYTAMHFQEAMFFFCPIYESLFDFNTIPANTKAFLKFLLFRTSARTPSEVINARAAKLRVPIEFTCLESVDIFRCYVLSNLAKDVTGSVTRVKHYFLNLFRASPNYNNGITSVKLDEMEDLIIDENADLINNEGLDDDELDFNILDGPAWMDFDNNNDDFFTNKPKIKTDKSEKEEATVIIKENVDILFDDEEFDLDAGMDEESESLLAEEEIDIKRQDPGTLMDLDILKAVEDRHDLKGSKIINRHFEECAGVIEHLKAACDLLTPTGRVRFLQYNARSINDTLKAIITKSGEFPETTSRVVSQLYPPGHFIYNFNLPISALCLIELYFKI